MSLEHEKVALHHTFAGTCSANHAKKELTSNANSLSQMSLFKWYDHSQPITLLILHFPSGTLHILMVTMIKWEWAPRLHTSRMRLRVIAFLLSYVNLPHTCHTCKFSCTHQYSVASFFFGARIAGAKTMQGCQVDNKMPVSLKDCLNKLFLLLQLRRLWTERVDS